MCAVYVAATIIPTAVAGIVAIAVAISVSGGAAIERNCISFNENNSFVHQNGNTAD